MGVDQAGEHDSADLENLGVGLEARLDPVDQPVAHEDVRGTLEPPGPATA